MRVEIITINYPEGEYNAKPGEHIFINAEDLHNFLTGKHPEFTSAVVVVLPDKESDRSLKSELSLDERLDRVELRNNSARNYPL